MRVAMGNVPAAHCLESIFYLGEPCRMNSVFKVQKHFPSPELFFPDSKISVFTFLSQKKTKETFLT